MTTLLDLFCTFRERGAKTALIHRTGVRRLCYSYAELHDLSLRMAGWLAAVGVGKGDRVVLWGPNSPWWVVSFWGTLARGAIAVPVDFMSGRERAETIAGLTGARLVIQSRAKMERMGGESELLLEDLEYHLAAVEPLPELASTAPDDIAQLIYTSGTTGNPKGVILTHGNLLANLEQVNRHIPIVAPAFNFLSLLPLSHMFEQMGGLFTPLSRGSAIVYLRTLKPSAIMEALGEEDIYAVIAVPRLLQLLKGSIERELEAHHLGGILPRLLAVGEKLPVAARRRFFFPVQRKFGSHFTLFVSGGAALDPEVFRFWHAMGFTVVEGYGLTECAPVLAANTMTEQVVGSVGTPLPGIELKLVDGEICARGANIFPGYYGNDTATREAFTAEGWFRTGDLGEIDPTGHVRIKGRSKELIVTGAGINVYPEELESILNRITGVREACVIGMAGQGGEDVHAVLIPDGSGRPPQEIIDEANGRLDPLHQITGWSLWPEAEFPKTTTLKVRKFLVRKRVEEGRGEGGGAASADLLVSLVARLTGTPPAAIREDSRLVADLGLTSIARLELVNYLEQEFRLDLDDSLIGLQTTMAELRSIISRREKTAGESHLRLWAMGLPVRALRRLIDLGFHYPLIRPFMTLETAGLDNLAKVPMPVIFIANHLSYLDQPAIMFALPPAWRYNTATAAWAEFFFTNFRNPAQMLWKRFTFEYATVALGVFPLPQTDGFRRALQHMGRLADRGINILVFPEGERSWDGRLLPFRQGLGLMVKELGVPVVPVNIAGVEKVLPKGGHWPRRGKVTVTFGAPLHFTLESPAEVVETARRAVESLKGGE
jgi:long-chain acyl-CoA synthetase